MTPEDVARFPLPGTNSPINLAFSPDDKMLSYLHADGGQMTRQLYGIDLSRLRKKKLVVPPNAGDTEENLSLEEKLRRERQRVHAIGVTSYFWTGRGSQKARIVVPLQGSLYVQDGTDMSTLRLLYDKAAQGDGQGQPCIDPQLSPDGTMVAFVRGGDLFAVAVESGDGKTQPTPVQLTFGATESCKHGVADFIAQEEMDRYRGFWWSLDSKSIAFTEVDEGEIPAFRIMHQGKDSVDTTTQEDHHYPFAGQVNPKVRLAVVTVDSAAIQAGQAPGSSMFQPVWMDTQSGPGGEDCYLARVMWLPDGCLGAQVENREQTVVQVLRLDPATGAKTVLLEETSSVWVNLHHLMRGLPSPVSPHSPHATASPPPPCAGSPPGTAAAAANGAESMDVALPEGSFSFLWGSERTGYMHIYLYTYIAGALSATCVLQLTSGNWVVESIVGVDQDHNALYIMGTLDCPCERNLYVVTLNGQPQAHPPVPQDATTTGALPNGSPDVASHKAYHKLALAGGSSNSHSGSDDAVAVSACDPVRLTPQSGMHNVVMDHGHKRFVDVYSTPDRPAKMLLYKLADDPFAEPKMLNELHTAMDDRVLSLRDKLKPAEICKIRSRDNAVDLYMGLYRPDPALYGNGPYPTIVAVYGGPHVQRVTKGWSTTVDMRAQRLRDLGFAVVKSDNRGSFRRGLAFEGWIKHNMGSIEVRDQEDVVRHLVREGITDPARVGIYGWSYGGYMTAMCMCKAPNTFKVGVSGAPVTSWDGYDTHYTERYMGTPQSNAVGYKESSVLTHAHKLNGKLMLVHGLMDENVHFRHTARLINSLIAARKHYDLLIFPDERHSPRKLQDRVYMEQRISDYFVQHLMMSPRDAAVAQPYTATGATPAPSMANQASHL
eukprot:TRINITY_DN2853_c0_g1_i1.p1 TRINITY_DN2853_c0_g1~~TRINITY_DN2853_c0_g1_i1.p1  ORF type:complete len:886 (-),score=215.81 TRINITY_DN2853_c0_g1_i1:61-2718(-)